MNRLDSVVLLLLLPLTSLPVATPPLLLVLLLLLHDGLEDFMTKYFSLFLMELLLVLLDDAVGVTDLVVVSPEGSLDELLESPVLSSSC